MKIEKIHNKGQARIVHNQYLEYLTKTHPLVIWGMYIPMIVLLPIYAAHRFYFQDWLLAALFLSGLFSWTLFEYVIH